MQDLNSSDTIAIQYEDAEELAPFLISQADEIGICLDILDGQWRQMQVAVTGLMIDAFFWQAGIWMSRSRALVQILKEAGLTLRTHSEQMHEVDLSYYKHLAEGL